MWHALDQQWAPADLFKELAAQAVRHEASAHSVLDARNAPAQTA